MASSETQVPLAPSLSRVARGSLCSGCGGCAAAAPGKVRMETKAPGYLRPTQIKTLTPEEDRLIVAICPGLGQTVEAAGRRDEVLWGPYASVFTGWANDAEIRHAGSSGGVLSAIILHLVETGVVDAVIENTAAADFPIGNAPLIARSKEDVIGGAGSRYAPSSPLADLPTHVASGLRHAFVGKPCDAVALRALAARDASVARAFPVILSFFCAGVPSHAGGREVLAKLGTSLEETTAFRFRGNGWPGRATALLRSGESRSMSYHDSWGGILSRHVQHRCKVCADGTGVAADIVCADAWESDENGYPVFEERDGVSLVMARTAKGQSLIDAAVAAGKITVEPFDIATLAAIQPGQRDRRRALAARLLALRLLGRPIPVYKGLRIAAAARQNTWRKNLRNFLGTARRVFRSAL